MTHQGVPLKTRRPSRISEAQPQGVSGWTGTNHGGHGEHGVGNEELQFVERR